jgi:hypothetical protein
VSRQCAALSSEDQTDIRGPWISKGSSRPVCSSSLRHRLDPKTHCSHPLQTDIVDDEFLLARILLLITYDTTADLGALLSEQNLEQSINEVKVIWDLCFDPMLGLTAAV